MFFLGSEKLQQGCYLEDKLVIGVKCIGFSGSEVVTYILNMPLRLIYLPLFGLAYLFSEPFSGSSLVMLLHGILLWFPLFYVGWYEAHGKHT